MTTTTKENAVVNESQWLSPKEAARELRVSKAIVLRSIELGVLPHVRLSQRTFRIPRSAISTEKQP
jgi:excisionase family DNA binding protein